MNFGVFMSLIIMLLGIITFIIGICTINYELIVLSFYNSSVSIMIYSYEKQTKALKDIIKELSLKD